jgi:hypothetical protein
MGLFGISNKLKSKQQCVTKRPAYEYGFWHFMFVLMRKLMNSERLDLVLCPD